ncbi:MAG: hypothetical protein KH353_12805 [Clostridium sp.]|nr:hypothetical protein [Clostridium sp.]
MKHKVEKTEAAIDYIEGHLSEMLNLELGAMAVSAFCLKRAVGKKNACISGKSVIG